MSKSDRQQTRDLEATNFQTTQWTDIAQAQTRDDAVRQKAVDALTSRYWKPVYCHLRWAGHAAEDALDLTQGFFQEIVLGRQLFQAADRSRGRFRSFLLAALNHYVASQYRKETARKRQSLHPTIDLEDLDVTGGIPGQTCTDPNYIFEYVWATELLDRVLAELRAEYSSSDRQVRWAVFHERLVGPIFEGRDAPSLTEICAKHGVESETVASNMIVTVKRRFRAILLRRLAETLQSDCDVEDELREFISIFSGGSAG